MIDHLGLEVRDYERSKAFYVPALAALWIRADFGVRRVGRRLRP